MRGKQTGLRHTAAAWVFSMQGLERLWQETGFRHEVVGFGACLALFAAIGVSPVHFLVLTILALLAFAMEALNTAIEELVDRLSPQPTSFGRHAKDLGSLAVFCTLTAINAFVLYVLATTLFF